MPDAPTAIVHDTPDWSPERKRTIRHTLWTGIGLTLLGAFGSNLHMADTIATHIVDCGTDLIMAAAGLHIGGASAERVGMWLCRGLQPPTQ